jgi:hypothetical protein
LLGRSIDGHALSKGHATTRMSAHVRMRSVGTVYPPFGDRY